MGKKSFGNTEHKRTKKMAKNSTVFVLFIFSLSILRLEARG